MYVRKEHFLIFSIFSLIQVILFSFKSLSNFLEFSYLLVSFIELHFLYLNTQTIYFVFCLGMLPFHCKWLLENKTDYTFLIPLFPFSPIASKYSKQPVLSAQGFGICTPYWTEPSWVSPTTSISKQKIWAGDKVIDTCISANVAIFDARLKEIFQCPLLNIGCTKWNFRCFGNLDFLTLLCIIRCL